MWGKVNLHTHTLFSDGRNSYLEMIKAYKDLEYVAIAITDHNKFFDLSLLKDLKLDGILVLSGCEHSNGEHWLEIRGETETLTVKAHPNRYGRTCSEIDREKWDAVEFTEHSVPHYEYLACNTPAVGTDDAHCIGMVGCAWIVVHFKEWSRDAIIRAIKEKDYALGGSIL
jgi:hypothetical protein